MTCTKTLVNKSKRRRGKDDSESSSSNQSRVQKDLEFRRVQNENHRAKNKENKKQFKLKLYKI